VQVSVASLASQGSSPLTRGKPPSRRSQPACSGLIPTHAGKTRRCRQMPSPWGAHPHSRGENANRGRPAVSLVGSSPLTRGKRSKEQNQRQRERLIPTHAGKTMKWWKTSSHTTAHPHSRGENNTVRRAGGGLRGSSPLTRGKLIMRPP